MVEFIDKTADRNGTPLNRANIMAIQGFEALETNFVNDNTIIETNSKGETLTTVLNKDGSIVETFKGEKTIVKTTIFNANGGISEVIS
jgi:exosome complex RNA-binding protein Rrp42 (RNase PH superfamily)